MNVYEQEVVTFVGDAIQTVGSVVLFKDHKSAEGWFDAFKYGLADGLFKV